MEFGICCSGEFNVLANRITGLAVNFELVYVFNAARLIAARTRLDQGTDLVCHKPIIGGARMDREIGWLGNCLGPTMLAGVAFWLVVVHLVLS